MEMESVPVSEVDVPVLEDLAAEEPTADGAVESVAATPAPAADESVSADPLPVDGELSIAPLTMQLAGIVEGLLFAAGAPVPLPRLVEALQGPSKAEVSDALRHLAARLDQDDRGIRLVVVAGAYQLRTATAHGPWVRRLLNAKPPRLSRPMLETLAIVAYRQPCTRAEIEVIRGVDADATLTTLIERRMARIVGRKEAPGRPILYGTTREFLEVFGLPDLSALPALPALAEAAALLTAPDLTVGADGVLPTAEASPTDEPQALDDPPSDTATADAATEGEAPRTEIVAVTPDDPAPDAAPIDLADTAPADQDGAP